IGCGWGGFARFASKKYGVKVVGVTISKEQAKLAAQLTKDLDVEIRLTDYRNVQDKFDRIVSIGMFEHVGKKNYRTFFDVVSKNLKKDGLFLLHTIGRNRSGFKNDPWLEKYIFPNSMLPSLKQIAKSAEKNFVIEDIHNIGTHYDKTLIAWYDNFLKYAKKNKLDMRFFRMWKYYLLSCAGSFRARKNQVWQIVFSKGALSYTPIRY
ncbi:cyclopropane-fatty-acyl-phospholipid synthase, partial [archaeon D22]